jgi:transaldolase
MTKLHDLATIGQAIWMDYIRRDLITSGKLDEWISDGLRGMTSNPSIFDKAISGSDAYDEQLRELVLQDKSPQEIYEALAIQDIQDAADALRDIWEQSGGVDGYISLEANPHLAHDTQGTIDEIRRLSERVNRPNVMYKIPATDEGLPAIEQLISEGVNVNITLMFSMEHYEKVASAYINGLKTLSVAGGDVASVASVASFFISRVDVKLDEQFEEMGEDDLKGKIGIANAKVVYQRFKDLFSSEDWEYLAEQGANVQRPLWASTSTKDPAYSDVLYVENLIGPYTVNTLPPDTLEAFLDHGTVAETVEQDIDEARAQLQRAEELGFDMNEVGEELQREGVEKFVRPFDSLMETIDEQRRVVLES